MQVCMYACIYVCMYVCICVCMCIYIYIYIDYDARIHIYTYTYNIIFGGWPRELDRSQATRSRWDLRSNRHEHIKHTTSCRRMNIYTPKPNEHIKHIHPAAE